MKTPLFTLLITASILLIKANLFAGAILELESTSTSKRSDKERIVVSVEDEKISMAQFEKGKLKNTMIFNNGTMYMVDHRKRSYQKIDKAQIKKMGSQISDATAQMESMLANLPEDQRAMVKQLMDKGINSIPGMPTAGAPRAKTVFRKTNIKKKINNYPATQIQALKNGVTQTQYWVTDPDNITGGSEIVKAFSALREFHSSLFDSLSSNPMAKSLGEIGNVMPDFEELGGFPVSTIQYKKGRPDSTTILKSSKKAQIPATSFEPPSGYKLRNMMQMTD